MRRDWLQKYIKKRDGYFYKDSRPLFHANCDEHTWLWSSTRESNTYYINFFHHDVTRFIKYFLDSAPHQEARLQFLHWFCPLRGNKINTILFLFHSSRGGDAHTIPHWFRSCEEARSILFYWQASSNASVIYYTSTSWPSVDETKGYAHHYLHHTSSADEAGQNSGQVPVGNMP